jgi:hypothetical protein
LERVKEKERGIDAIAIGDIKTRRKYVEQIDQKRNPEKNSTERPDGFPQ